MSVVKFDYQFFLKLSSILLKIYKNYYFCFYVTITILENLTKIFFKS